MVFVACQKIIQMKIANFMPSRPLTPNQAARGHPFQSLSSSKSYENQSPASRHDAQAHAPVNAHNNMVDSAI